MVKNKLFYIVLLVSVLFLNLTTKAQLVTISGPTGNIPCDSSATFTANVSSSSGLGNGTDTYSVVNNIYLPYSYTGSNVLTQNGAFNGVSDDWWSTVLPLPFTFCFFGVSYDSIVVGENGQIGFDITQTNSFNPFVFSPAPTFNTAMNNCIMAPALDIFPFISANPNVINWDVYGVAPNRVFVVSWLDNPMFGCTSTTMKSQAVLHEGSNIIDINIADKPFCSWQSNTAIEGIQDATGTVAFTVPGRNASSWTATNDSWSFVPAGAPISIVPTYQWLDSATNVVLGTGSTLTLNPPLSDLTIILNVTAPSACAQLNGSDTTRFTSGVVADYSYVVGLGCDNDTVTFTNLSTPATGSTYAWNFGDGGTSNIANPTHIYLTQGVYNVRLITFHPPCTPDTVIKQINLLHPLDAGFTQDKIVVCKNDPVTFTDTTIGTIVTWVWNLGDGTIINNQTNFSHTYLTNGTFTVTLTVTDNLGCVDSAKKVITNNQTDANFSVIKHLGCDFDTVVFTNLSAGGTQYVWAFGDGTGSAQTNPTHVYQNQSPFNPPNSPYQVMLISTNANCNDTIIKPVDLRHPLLADFGYVNKVCFSVLPHTSPQFIGAPSSGDGINFQWFWGDGSNTTIFGPLGTTTTHNYGTPGNYTIKLVITDSLGCKDSIAKNIFVDNPPFESLTALDASVCVGEPVVFKDSVAPLATAFWYNFGDGKIDSNIHNPIHTYDLQSSPVYTVTLGAKYTVCPDDKVEIYITVTDFPKINLGPDTSICTGTTGQITLSNILNSSGLQNIWSTGEIGNTITITQPGHYWLTTSQNGCSSTDSIWVKNDCYISFPNSFSPNGDGLNDYFISRQLESMGVTRFSFKIFNRWGEEVFTTTNVNGRGWDGKFGGKPQPIGTYVYYADVYFKNNTKKSLQGNFTLIR